MNFPTLRVFRLAPRGQGGLAIDDAGIALGAASLMRVAIDAKGRRHAEIRPMHGLGDVLAAAYGPQSEDVLHRLHRGLRRAAAAVEADNICLAGIETVLLGLPDPASSALAKLEVLAALEKDADTWRDQPRNPRGQPDGGQWTAEGGDASGGAKPTQHTAPRAVPAVAVIPHKPKLPISDGVYRPGVDGPHVVPVAGGGEEEPPPPRGSNGPPPDYTRLEDVFVGLQYAPTLEIPLAPVDGFLGFSASYDLSDWANAETLRIMILNDIAVIDPSFRDVGLQQQGGLPAMSPQQRTDYLDHLRMQRAAITYLKTDDVGPLQV